MVKQNKNTNKGITLIALVITIIVMLILVGVTITMAVRGGLFEYAGRAGTKTNEAIIKEQQLASGKVNISGKIVDIQDYVDDIIQFKLTFLVGDEFVFKVKRGTTMAEFIGEEMRIQSLVNEDRYYLLKGNGLFMIFTGGRPGMEGYGLYLDEERVDYSQAIQENGIYSPV